MSCCKEHTANGQQIPCARTCASPVLTYSPLLNEQHSLLSMSWLTSCTFTKLKSCWNSSCARGLGTKLSFRTVSSPSKTPSMSDQALPCAALPAAAALESLPGLLCHVTPPAGARLCAPRGARVQCAWSKRLDECQWQQEPAPREGSYVITG